MAERPCRIGEQVPAVHLAESKEGNVQRIFAPDFFAARRVILFALPGAFTPTCSAAHVPGYLARLKDFHDAGIDEVVCLAVNDPDVMDGWQRAQKAQGIRFLADSNGDFTAAMGMSVDHRDNFLGVRSWRCSMLVENGTIAAMFIEPDVTGDPLTTSDADTMWRDLRPNQKASESAFMLARHGCPFCERAKDLLRRHDVSFDAIHLGEGLSMRGVKAATGAATVPQVFMAGKLIGGAEELAAHFAGGR
jgi:peroxiredoxin/glutaredoxin